MRHAQSGPSVAAVRRALLRGAGGLAVALPFLDAMSPASGPRRRPRPPAAC